MNPHDVDVMTDSRSIEEITDFFSDYLIEPIVDTNGWLTKDFGVIFLHARIDIASDPQDILDIPEPSRPWSVCKTEPLDHRVEWIRDKGPTFGTSNKRKQKKGKDG